MRRWGILLSVLCLAAGAVAMAQALHFQLRIAALFSSTPSTSSASARTPLAALDMSSAQPSSERDSVGSTEHSESPTGGESARGGDGETSGSDAVKLDLAQISTTGSTSVFAGRAAPGAPVTVFENGVPVATATANANGDWSLATDHKFAGPDPKFSLRTGSFRIPAEAQADDVRGASAAAPSAPLVSQAASRPASASPSGELLKSFESKVASAREEVAAQHQAETAPPSTPATASPVASTDSKPATVVSAVSPSPATVQDANNTQSASIPVPMTFVFDQATLTPDGEKTARLLLEYLQLKKFTSVTLSGHADERGTVEYNLDLSRKRLDTVSAFLRSRGYQGKLDLVAKGASEPFMGVDRSKYSPDDLMQLDRRVEVRNAM
jgi:outer membrane protein OmpA-like peptidoglycan-associated protein